MDFKATTQYIVKCKGSSQPVVDHLEQNPNNPNYVDLHLWKDLARSNNVADYDVQYKSNHVKTVKLEGNILTVENVSD